MRDSSPAKAGIGMTVSGCSKWRWPTSLLNYEILYSASENEIVINFEIGSSYLRQLSFPLPTTRCFVGQVGGQGAGC